MRYNTPMQHAPGPPYRTVLPRAIHRGLDLVYPQFCAVCGRFLPAAYGESVCRWCLFLFPFLPSPFCSRCGLPLNRENAGLTSGCQACRRLKLFFDRALSAFAYNPILKIIIHQFKYRRKAVLAGPLAERLGEFMSNHLPTDRIDTVSAVPLHPRRTLDRGFNQAHLLAQCLACRLKLPYEKNLLQRIRHTPLQAVSSYEQRRHNMTDAFRVRNPQTVTGKNVLLIDDVLTTGATLNECSRVLKNAGASRVLVATLARTVLP